MPATQMFRQDSIILVMCWPSFTSLLPSNIAYHSSDTSEKGTQHMLHYYIGKCLAKKHRTWKQVFLCCIQITWALGHISLACPIIHSYSMGWINLQTSIKECNSMTGSSAMCSSESLTKNNRRLQYGLKSFEKHLPLEVYALVFMTVFTSIKD